MSADKNLQSRTVRVLKLEGRLTVEAISGVVNCAPERVFESRSDCVVLDMEHLTQVDCAGIGWLTRAYRCASSHGVTLMLFQVPPRVRALLQLFHLDGLFRTASPDAVAGAHESRFELTPDPTRFRTTPWSPDQEASTSGGGTPIIEMAPTEHEGDKVGHYRLKKKLGEGGMGVVFRAIDTTLQRDVALKFLKPRALVSRVMRNQFFCEARAAAALDHPNVCTVFEIAEENGRAYLAMAYIDGETLAARLSRGRLPLEEALGIGIQVANGLQAAHHKGIVHRDIKPANLMLDHYGKITITDFGLAYQLDKNEPLPLNGAVLGTPAYMSPEQSCGESVDWRTDIWALGALLYEAINGHLPGDPTAARPTGANGRWRIAPAPRSEVVRELKRAVRKAMARRPADRYQEVSQLASDLVWLRAWMRSEAPEVAPRVAPLRPATDLVAGTARCD